MSTPQIEAPLPQKEESTEERKDSSAKISTTIEQEHHSSLGTSSAPAEAS
jgi:hypothetical protein